MWAVLASTISVGGVDSQSNPRESGAPSSLSSVLHHVFRFEAFRKDWNFVLLSRVARHGIFDLQREWIAGNFPEPGRPAVLRPILTDWWMETPAVSKQAPCGETQAQPVTAGYLIILRSSPGPQHLSADVINCWYRKAFGTADMFRFSLRQCSLPQRFQSAHPIPAINARPKYNVSSHATDSLLKIRMISTGNRTDVAPYCGDRFRETV